MKALTIGKVAKQAGIGVETIRFYERRGLLEEPPRNDSGYRQYPPEAGRFAKSVPAGFVTDSLVETKKT